MKVSLPKSWKLVTISEVSEKSQYGYTTKAVEEGQVHLLRTTDITKGRIIWNTVPYCKDDPDEVDKYQVEIGDILISRAGSVGESFLIHTLPENPAVFASYLIRFKPTINTKYFKYFLNSPGYWNSITENQSGIAVPNVNATKINAIEFPLAPRSTQDWIVEKIEELFSELDNGLENLKKAQKQLKTYRQAVLKDAFEGKLTKKWREQQADLPTPEGLLQQIKAERKAYRQRELAEWEKEVEQWEKNGKPGRKPRKPKKAKELDTVGKEDLSKLPEIPDNWKYVRIGNLGNVGTGATPLKKENSYYENGTIPWVTSGALNNEYVREASDFVTKKALNETNLSLFPKHTLLVAMYGEGKTRGKCSELLIEATTNQAIAAIVQNEVESKTKDFLKYYLLKNYNDIRRMSSGGVQPNLNLGIIENTIVPLAPEKEQKEIVNEIESRLSVVDQLEQTIKENLQKAEALRQSILKKAFGGELVEEEIKVKEAEISPFQQMQMIGVLINILKEEYDMAHGEMALAKYLFLIDRIKKYRTGFNFKDWHWGPYDPAIRKIVFSKQSFFRKNKDAHSVIELKENRDQLFKYHLNDQDTLEAGVREVAEIISKFKGRKKTSRQLELLATVAKVVENESSTNLEIVRTGMKNWKTPKTKFKSKADKFSKEETAKCLTFINKQGWDAILV